MRKLLVLLLCLAPAGLLAQPITSLPYILPQITGSTLIPMLQNGRPVVATLDQVKRYLAAPTSTSFYSNGGALAFLSLASGWSPSSSGLPAGSVYSNGLEITVVPGITPNPAAPPVYFGVVTPPQLLTLGGGNLPLTQPTPGSKQLWNNGGVVCIA